MLSEYRRLDQLHLPRAEEQSTAPYGMEFKPTLNLYRPRQQIIDKAKMPTIKGLSIGLHSVPVHAIIYSHVDRVLRDCQQEVGSNPRQIVGLY